MVRILGTMMTKNHEQHFKAPGVKVIIKYKRSSPFGRRQSTYRNVTEIHMNYPSPVGKQVAFESDVHKTGITQLIKHVESIKVTQENKKARDF